MIVYLEVGDYDIGKKATYELIKLHIQNHI